MDYNSNDEVFTSPLLKVLIYRSTLHAYRYILKPPLYLVYSVYVFSINFSTLISTKVEICVYTEEIKTRIWAE